MKNNIKYIKLIGIFVLALVISAACVKWDEETNPTLESASTVTLEVFSTGDSSVVISYSNSMNGYVALNLYEGTGNEVPTDEDDREAMLTGNVVSMEYYTGQTVTGGVYQYTFEGLVQDASYEVMGVANNDDGVVSEVTVQVVNTSDSHSPVLTGTNPEISVDPLLPVDGSVVLIFDEAVFYDDTKNLTFTELLDAEDVVAGSVTVSGNEVTVTPGEELTNRDYVLLSYPEGAFTDASGNLAAEMDSYYDAVEDELIGLYWRAETKVFDALSLTPTEEYQTPGFDIVVTFAEAVSVAGVEDGDITLSYDDGLDVLNKAVLASELSTAGNVLTITQSNLAVQGVKINLDIPEDVFTVGYGNPNGEVTASWTIVHPTLQPWVGDYNITAVSYAVPGSYDEVWSATIAAAPSDVNSLAISLNGEKPFLATFDSNAMTITIASGTNAGDFYGYGPTLMYVGDYATIDMVSDITGTIGADGSILIDELALVLAAYGYYWDAFNTTWTPAAKKAAPSFGNFASKAARFE